MPTSEKITITKLKKEFFQKIGVEWDTKWRVALKNPYPKDFKKINLNLFVTLLSEEMNKCVSENEQIADKKSSFIGTQTLRRILENPENQTSFQLTTKNNIACYLGYNSWANYLLNTDITEIIVAENKNHENTIDIEKNIGIQEFSNEENSATGKNKKIIPKRIIFISIALIVIVLAILKINQRKANPKKYPQTIPFKILNATNNGVAPTKISFAINLMGMAYDSAFINYDGFKVPITKQIDTFSHTYVHPTIRNIVVRLDTTEYHFITPINSKDWIAFFKKGPNLPEKMFKKPGKLHIDLENIPIELFNEKDYYVFYQKFTDFNIDADSLTFETKVKNNEGEGGISCYDVSIGVMMELNSKANNVAFNILHPSCTEYIHLIAGKTDIGYGGKAAKMPLTPLGIDISEWTNLKFITKNHVLTIFAKEKQIYQIPYDGPLGKVKMIQIEFKGSGSIDFVKMSNSYTGKLAFYNGFD
jgi:hypothetical protein